MRKLIGLILLPFVGALAFFVIIGFIHPQIKVNYNGQEINFNGTNPFFYEDGKNSAIVAPIDIISSNVGATTNFNNDNKSVTIKKSADTIIFYEDKDVALVNGREKKLPVKSVYKDNHLYVPVRVLAETLGKSIFWDASVSTLNMFDSLQNSFSLDKNASQYTSTDNFKIGEGKIMFQSNPEELKKNADYILEEKLNANINKHIYDMARVLLDKSYYMGIEYNTSSENNISNPVPHVTLSLAKSQTDYLEDNSLLAFTFYEKKALNVRRIWKQKEFSQSSVIKLELNSLYDGNKPQDSWVDPFYENRLKLALISLFQENMGLEISEYIIQEYNNIRNDTEGEYNSYKKSKRIEYVKVDLAHVVYPDSKDTVYVYFSF